MFFGGYPMNENESFGTHTLIMYTWGKYVFKLYIINYKCKILVRINCLWGPASLTKVQEIFIC